MRLSMPLRFGIKLEDLKREWKEIRADPERLEEEMGWALMYVTFGLMALFWFGEILRWFLG